LYHFSLGRLPTGVATIAQYLSKRPQLLPTIPLKYRAAAHLSSTEDETAIAGVEKKRAKEAATEQVEFLN